MSISISQVVGIAKEIAVKYSAVSITDISPNASKTGIVFTLSDSSKYTIPLTTMDIMMQSIYDSNLSGIVDNSEALQGKDLIHVLDRTNHTGTQDSSTMTVDKTKFSGNLKKYTELTVQKMFEYIDKMYEFTNNKIVIGEENIDNSFKLEVQGSHLVLYRFQNGIWTEVTRFGSVESDRFILKDTASSIVFNSSDGNTYTLIKPSVDTKGIVSGNFLGRNVLMNNGELLSVSENGALTDISRTTIDTDIKSIATVLTFSRTAPESEAVAHIKIYMDTNGIVCRLILRDENNAIIARSTSDYDFGNNIGNISIVGENIFTFLEPIALRKNEKYKLEIQTKGIINIKGDNSGAEFIPKYTIGVYPLLESTVLTSNNINNVPIDYGSF